MTEDNLLCTNRYSLREEKILGTSYDFRPHLNEMNAFLNSSDYKIIFEKLRFRSAVIDE